MSWFRREHTPLSSVTPVMNGFGGLKLVFNTEGTLHTIHGAQCTLDVGVGQNLRQALTTDSALPTSFTQAQGQFYDVGFKTLQGEKQARVWIEPLGNDWQLTGVWIDDLIVADHHEQQRRQLLSATAKGCMAIRQAPAAYLARATEQVLLDIAQILEAHAIAVAIVDQGQWRIFALTDTHSIWWPDMSVDNTLCTLMQKNSGQLLDVCELAGRRAVVIAYPSPAKARAWLMLNLPNMPQGLRSEDWQLLSAQLGLALVERLEEAHSQTQTRRTTLLQELLQAGWWEFDPTQQRVLLGDFLAQTLEVCPSLSEAQWLELIHPADVAEFNARLQSKGDAHFFSHALRLNHPHDNHRWYQLQAQRKSAQGQWHGYLLDIDDLKRHQAQTEWAHARLKRLVAKAPAVIYVEQCTQGALSLSFASSSLEPLLGWNVTDLEQGKLASVVHPDDLELFFERKRGLLADGQHRCKYRLRDRQGSDHWLLDEATVLRDEQGNAQEVVGIWVDVTDATQAAEQIAASEERYRALVEDSPAMICRYGPNLELRFANQPMAKYLEVEPSTLIGADFSQWLSAEQKARFALRFAKMTPQEPVVTSEICVKLPGCEHAWWVWVERGIFNENNQLIEIQAVGRDNTDVRRTQQQLNQSAKMATLGEMATGMAHEMNQPLHVMRMAIANVLRRLELNTLDPDYLAEKLGRIDAQIKRAARIVDHMRVFGRRSALETQLFDPQTCVYEAVALLDESFKALQIGVFISCGTQHVNVDGHADQLEQVLINLMVNAKDALLARREQQEGFIPKIEIDTVIEHDRVRIYVQDNGGGIEPALQERIFDPFFTTKEVGKGTGLGLSVSFGIVEQMKGLLSVTNHEDGAQFCIDLPIATAT